MGFQYKARPSEKWEKRASGNTYEGYAKDQYHVYKVKPENMVRVLPPTWEDAQHYGIDIWVHWSVGPGKATVLCPFRMNKGKCPICEAQSRAELQGREDAKELKPSRRVLVWLVDKAEQPEKQPYLWAMPWTVDRDVSMLCRDRISGEIYAIDNPDAGYDLSFQLSKKGGNATFQEYVGLQIARKATSVDERHLEYIIANPLHNTLYWRTYEEISRLFDGGMTEADEVKPPMEEIEEAPIPTAFTSVPNPPTTPTPNFHAAPPSTPVAVMPVPKMAPPVPPTPPRFVPEWTGTACQVCGKPQFTLEAGGIGCEQGHLKVVEETGNGKAEQVPQVAAPTRAAALRARMSTKFETGPKQ